MIYRRYVYSDNFSKLHQLNKDLWYIFYRHQFCFVWIAILSLHGGKYFLNWHPIDWQHSRHPFRSHVRKHLLTDMEFNMDCTLWARPL